MLAIQLSDSLAAKLKAVSMRHGKAEADMAVEALEHWLDADEWTSCRTSCHEPNEETAKALSESLRGEKGKAYSSVSDLFAELDSEC